MYRGIATFAVCAFYGSGILAQISPEAGLITAVTSGSLAVGSILMMFKHMQDGVKHIGARDSFVNKETCAQQHKNTDQIIGQVSRQNKLILRLMLAGHKNSPQAVDTQIQSAIEAELDEQE